MSLITGLAVFFVVWWLVFFVTLPFGVRTPEEAGVEEVDGQAPSAPVKPRLWLKALVTTIVTGILVISSHLLIEYGIIDLRALLTGRESR